jgi:hypothetical protein
MELISHVITSSKLLEAANCEVSAAVFSLFPSIDNVPSHYHRVYSHNVLKLKPLRLAGFAIFRNGAEKVMQHNYETKRIMEEKEHFLELLKYSEPLLPKEDLYNFKDIDAIASDISLLSHLYFDTFNNPVQVFVPDCVYCSGQWTVWEELNHEDYRNSLTDKKFLASFREGIANLKVWERKVDPKGLAVAMVQRLADLLVPEQDLDVQSFLVKMDPEIDWAVSKSDRENAYDFCCSCEREIFNTILLLLKR